MIRGVFIELCNFADWPMGGHLSFARHLARAMEGEIDLVGVATEEAEPVGGWFTKVVEGHGYRFYNVGRGLTGGGRPLVPARLRHLMLLRRHIKKLKLERYDRIIVQTPEVLFNIPRHLLPRVVLVMPGLSNPLAISRYAWATHLAPLYDRLFFSRARHVKRLLCAADADAIATFVKSSRGRLSPERVLQFPTRYDADIFHPAPQPAETATEMASETARDKAPRLITTGRLTRLKGWQLMVDALRLLLPSHPGATLTFIGDGEDRQLLEAYIATLNLQGSVILAGKMPPEALAHQLSHAHCFIMGSEVEGWSTSLVEAVACGVPCVVTRFSSATEMVTDGRNGYVLQSRTPAEFAARISDALHLPPAPLRQCALLAHARFSVQTLKPQFEKLCE